VVAHGPRRFGSEALPPEVRMKAIADLDFFDVIDDLGEEPAVADQSFVGAKDNSEL
jgi:hypothetical protein